MGRINNWNCVPFRALLLISVVGVGGVFSVDYSDSYARTNPLDPLPLTPTVSSGRRQYGSRSSESQSQSQQQSKSGLEYRHREVLDAARGDVLEWEVDCRTNSITFTISVQTRGYVALGLSRTGRIEGADIVVGGVRHDGKAYLLDMHGLDNSTIAQDVRQDWTLITKQSSEVWTILQISRKINTCDEEDIEINNSNLHIIYAYGDDNSDQIPTELTPRGNILAYLLDPVTTPTETRLSNWSVSRRMRIPNRSTTYWCSIHRGPRLKNKHHIVGFSPSYGNEQTRTHLHHQLVYRCITPPGVDAATLFDRFVDHPGEECYLEENHQLPTVFCTEIVHTFGIDGVGKSFQFPEDIGIPISGIEYFMYETHYSREREQIAGDIIVESGVDFQITPQLRREEGTMFFAGHGTLGIFMVPPRTPEMNIIGHCSAECLLDMIPPGGMKIHAVSLHSHLTTRRMKFRHFRGNQELPWIINDDNYEFLNQQYRLLRDPRELLPGDQLATECTMETLGRNATTTQGYSVWAEMCISFVLVNKRIPYFYCSSEVPAERYMKQYGIQNMTWDVQINQRVVNDAENPDLIGRTISGAVDYQEWTPQRRVKLEHEQYYGEHQANCHNNRETAMLGYSGFLVDGLTRSTRAQDQLNNIRPSVRTMGLPSQGRTVTFPKGAQSYVPPDTCEAVGKQINYRYRK